MGETNLAFGLNDLSARCFTQPPEQPKNNCIHQSTCRKIQPHCCSPVLSEKTL